MRNDIINVPSNILCYKSYSKHRVCCSTNVNVVSMSCIFRFLYFFKEVEYLNKTSEDIIVCFGKH